MFDEGLRRRLDGEEEREIRVVVLESFYRKLRAAAQFHQWEEDDGVRQILALGLQTLREWRTTDKTLEEMTSEERLRFLQDRAGSLDAAYSTLRFQAHQVMRQNDALQLNMKGLMPQLQAARERVEELEAEVRRLRALVPPEDRDGKVLIRDSPPATTEDRPPAKRRGLLGR